MAFAVQAESPPLHEDADGALRVGQSRVLLELVIRAFQDGATPETIVQRYATVSLPDAYAVVAYYLRHRGEIDEYLARRERQADQIQQRIERQQGDLSAFAPACHEQVAQQSNGEGSGAVSCSLYRQTV